MSETYQGLLLSKTPQGLTWVSKYVGEPGIPSEVRQRRRYVDEALRRVGAPVLFKHRWNDEDVANGIAEESPAFNDVYGQTVSYDALSHGVGYCSVELSDDEWYDTTTGEIITSVRNPGNTYARAPKYRGYGPGYILFVIEPDASLDYFRLSETGALIKVQDAQATAPWFPDMNDNDLLINVELDNEGNIVATDERYELKQSNPSSLRGRDIRGRREGGADGGNRYVLSQNFQMSLVPWNHPIQKVETDR